MNKKNCILRLGFGIILLAFVSCSIQSEANPAKIAASQFRAKSPTAQHSERGLSNELKLFSKVPITIPQGRYGNYQGYHPIDWSSDGKTFAYSWNDSVWVMEISDSSVRRLATIPNGRLGEVYYSPDGKQLAFFGNQFLDNQSLQRNFIWTTRNDGTELKNLTASMNLSSRLTYVNNWLNSNILTFYIWHGNGVQTLNTVQIATGEIKTLIGVQEDVPSPQAIGGDYYFSSNRKMIAIQTGFGGQVALVSTQLPNLRKWITDAQFPLRQSFQAWLPDNQRFLYTEYTNGDPDLGVFSSDVSLRLSDINTNTFTKLLDGVATASPSPDGTKVAFLRQKNSEWDYARLNGLNVNQSDGVTALELGVLDLTSNQVNILGAAGYKPEENADLSLRYWQLGKPVWSPDGKLLAYWGDDGNAYLVSFDGSWRQQLTNDLEIVQFLWSSDASKLAFRTMNQAWIIENPKK